MRNFPCYVNPPNSLTISNSVRAYILYFCDVLPFCAFLTYRYIQKSEKKKEIEEGKEEQERKGHKDSKITEGGWAWLLDRYCCSLLRSENTRTTLTFRHGLLATLSLFILCPEARHQAAGALQTRPTL